MLPHVPIHALSEHIGGRRGWVPAILLRWLPPFHAITTVESVSYMSCT